MPHMRGVVNMVGRREWLGLDRGSGIPNTSMALGWVLGRGVRAAHVENAERREGERMA